MSKLLFCFIFTLITTFLFFFSPQKVTAAYNCTFTYQALDSRGNTMESPNTYMDKLRITVTSPNLPPIGGRYLLAIQDPQHFSSNAQNYGPLPTFTVTSPDSNNLGGLRGWHDKTYIVYMFTGDTQYRTGAFGQNRLGGTDLNAALCKGTVKVTLLPTQKQCKLTIPTRPIEPTTPVLLEAENIQAGNTYKIVVEPQAGTPKGTKRELQKYFDDTSGNLNLGSFIGGSYQVTVSMYNKVQCAPIFFNVGATGSGQGEQVSTSSNINTNTPTASAAGISCDPKTGLTGSGGVLTAVGCVPTDPVELVKSLLKVSVFIGGGLALLLMIYGAFLMITSAGNPDGVKKGSEQITNAVIGLLFIIFSVLLLQIIGVDILKIEGFM